ncbi:ABC transporter substrate-binding protein [Ahrensia sp. 13_GOM-1096m]|uniref:ABC transporter substrate-binding protein n=1 Tax=Ahrensia sp. 13_GOM-1096m TaxID=1380380 RepID=UPI0004787DDE|nr:ABC transporter substrate-binding protein [Ahrensia sp. 13_GOM-1096m]
MKKILAALAATTLMTSAAISASHSPVKIGVILGFTGPIESLTPTMAASAELAMKEATDSGKFLDGAEVMSVRADSTCIDSAAASAAAERLITAEGVTAIMGADCSGVTGAILQNVARANGIVMISPSATSPALSDAEDDGLFFRTSPSDARQGDVLADVLIEKGVKSAALTYTNNDYGKGLSDSIQAAFEAKGGTITISAAHEDGKGDYSAEVGALAQAGGDVLIVAGYLDQGGKGIIQGALDAGAFETFVLPDGMVGDSLPAAIGAPLNGSYGTIAGSESEGADLFQKLATDAGVKTDTYAAESYDAAALILLAMQAAKSANSADFKDKVMDVANAPGEKILPGEIGKALEILAAGGEVDYVGATAVEFIGNGESGGSFRQILVDGEKITTEKYR